MLRETKHYAKTDEKHIQSSFESNEVFESQFEESTTEMWSS